MQLAAEPLADLGYAPQVGLSEMVSSVLGAHEERNLRTAQAFKEMGGGKEGSLTRSEIESHVRKYLVRGREDYAHTGQDAVGEFVDRLMEELDTNGDGHVEWLTFSDWNRRNSVEEEIWKQVRNVEDALRKQIREMGGTPRA